MARCVIKNRRRRRILSLLGGLMICLPSACHRPAPAPTLTPAQPPPATKTPPRHDETRLTPVPTASRGENDPARWLYAERFAPGTTGGYAEGDFSAKRNRLTIKTLSVTRFAVDTRYLSIDWDKLVVIQINGHNSELRRRDDPVLHFVLDKNDQWVVEE